MASQTNTRRKRHVMSTEQERSTSTASTESLKPVWGRVPGAGERRPTRAEAVASAGAKLAASDLACAQMTPREQAEAAWTPTYSGTVNELEDLIRTDRGLPPIHREEQP